MSIRLSIFAVIASVLMAFPAVSLGVGDKIRFEGFRDEVETGVIVEVLRDGALFRVERTSGTFKGHNTLVRREDVLGKGAAPEKAPDKGPDMALEVGDEIRFQRGRGEIETGVITEVLSRGEVFRVERTSGKSKGRPTSVRKSDVLGKVGGQEKSPDKGPDQAPGDVPENAPDKTSPREAELGELPLEGERITIRQAGINRPNPLPVGEPIWDVPPVAKLDSGWRSQTIPITVGTGSFFETMRLVLCGDKLIASAVDGPPGKDVTGAMQVVSLKTGRVSQPIAGLMPLAASYDGSVVVLSTLESRYRRGIPAGPLRAMKVLPDGGLEPICWFDINNQEGDSFGRVVPLSEGLLLIEGTASASVYAVSDGKMLYSLNTHGSDLTIDPIRGDLLLSKTGLVDSPEGGGGMVRGTTCFMIEAASGNLIGQRAFPFSLSKCAISPDASKMIALSESGLVTVNPVDGEVLGRLGGAKGAERLTWLDDRFVLIQGQVSMVFDTETQLFVWRYGEFIPSRSSVSWASEGALVVPADWAGKGEAKLVVTPIDIDGYIASSRKIDPAEALATTPGTAIRLAVKGTQRQAIRRELSSRLVAGGLVIHENSGLRMEVTSNRERVDLQYKTFGSREVTEVSGQSVSLYLKLFDGDQQIWGTSRSVSPPPVFSLKEGETIQQAISRHISSDTETRLAKRIGLPLRVMRSQAVMQLPSSKIE